MSEDYEYELLQESGTIRLLYITPGRRDDKLEGRLKAALLCNYESYEALSYTWGAEGGHHAILIDRKRVSITRNCATAIRDLRRQDKTRVLWIDAICINQQDQHEKGRQVSLMGEIYARAERTVVYLGAGDGTVQLLRQRIRIVPGTGLAVLPSQQTQVEDARKILLARDWFHRKWIIQEVLLSRDILVQAGAHEFTWPELEMLDREHRIEILRLAKKYLRPVTLTSGLINGHDPDPKAKAAWHEMLEQGEVFHTVVQQSLSNTSNLPSNAQLRSPPPGFLLPPQVFDILSATSDFGCKEPRDRIFAISSLFASQWNIPIDYSCDEQEVYDALTKELMVLGDTRFLWIEDRVSWKPNWKTALSTLAASFRERGGFASRNFPETDIGRLPKELQLERRDWNESDSSKAIWTTPGIRLGWVSSLATETFEPRHTKPGDMSAGHPNLEHWNSILATVDLNAFSYETGSHPLSHIHHRNRERLRWYRDWTLDLLSRSGQSAIQDFMILKQSAAHHHGHISFCKGMRLFVCDNGLTGIAPAYISNGDAVYFLPGYSCPFVIIRPKDDQYTLVSLAWFGPLKLFPACFDSKKNVFDRNRLEIIKII